MAHDVPKRFNKGFMIADRLELARGFRSGARAMPA
jgi:hypothetical protein